jgi:hypothetical protein
VSDVEGEYYEDRSRQDFIRVNYDPGQLTPGQILEAVRKESFNGTIVPEQPGQKRAP